MREVLKIYITSLKSRRLTYQMLKLERFSHKLWIFHLQIFDKYKEKAEIRDIDDNFFLFCTI